MHVKVVRGSTAGHLENEINNALKNNSSQLVDIKLSGAYDGKHETFFAVIIFKD